MTQRVKDARLRKCREVRDLYSKLRKTYNYEMVLIWFDKNYHIQEHTIIAMIRRSDNKPVDLDNASINYLTAIKTDFKI